MNRNKTKFNATIILLFAMILLVFIGSINACAEDEYMNQMGTSTEESTEYTLDEGNNPSESNGELKTPSEEYSSGESGANDKDFAPENSENNASGGDTNALSDTNQGDSGDFEKNLFEEIYQELELNADKIFSVLAFIGTLIVGLGYKSGLLPLLRENMSRLKGTIDLVKADGEESKTKNEERFTELTAVMRSIAEEIKDMKGGYECYKEMNRQRESLRLILEGQIDMLYAIFMTSALPQYQKDEIGEKINKMREELKIYESDEEN